jgi:glycosyltransferase involved in cell wall biosynthesis
MGTTPVASRVCALVPYPPNTTPSQRFRLEQWKPVLEAEGMSVDLKPFAGPELMAVLHQTGRRVAKTIRLLRALIARAAVLTDLDRYDAIVVHRAAVLAGPAWLERLLGHRRPLVYDFDDAIFVTHTTAANQRFGWLKFAGKTATICRASRHVVVGNRYLADYARRYNRRVTVIPSSVDTDEYVPRPKAPRQPPVVGWMGSSTSQSHLERFAPVLRVLAARAVAEIRIVSDRRPQLDGVPFEWRPWAPEREIDDLRAFDIGIMPMPDDTWSRGKCAMKALLYMSVGVPTVCSAVGMNTEVIRDGDNGYLATTPAEWLDRLTALACEPELRARLGTAGRATVEAHYSMRHSAKRFGDVLHAVIEGDHGVIADDHGVIADDAARR